jgi:hypothetical protein
LHPSAGNQISGPSRISKGLPHRIYPDFDGILRTSIHAERSIGFAYFGAPAKRDSVRKNEVVAFYQYTVAAGFCTLATMSAICFKDYGVFAERISISGSSRFGIRPGLGQFSR